MLERHRLIALPWISVSFLLQAGFWLGSGAKFFSSCVYVETSFQTRWAGAACKLSGKNITSLKRPIEPVVQPNVQIWQASCFLCSRNDRAVFLLKQSQLTSHPHLNCNTTGGFWRSLNKSHSIFCVVFWYSFLHLFLMHTFQILRTGKHKANSHILASNNLKMERKREEWAGNKNNR